MIVTWSNIKFFLKIQNGGRSPCWKIFEMSYLAYQWTDWDPTWVFTSHHVPDMSAMMRLPWQPPLLSNGALNIRQLWAFGSQTREPILMKFGTQQHVSTKMTVTWSNIKIFKIQNGGRSLLESIRNAITRLQMDRLGRSLGGGIPSYSQYWKCYNSSYDGTDWDDSWMGASKQHLCCKTVSLVFGRYC